MALEERVEHVSYENGAAVALEQYTCVKPHASLPRSVIKCTAAAKAAGVVYNKPAATIGHAVTVCISGIAKIKAGAAVATGVSVDSDANGKVIAGTTNPVGITVTAATAANQVIEVLLTL